MIRKMFLMIVVCMVFAGSAQAILWMNNPSGDVVTPGDGLWSTAANWDTGLVPTGAAVFISAADLDPLSQGNGYMVTIDGTSEVAGPLRMDQWSRVDIINGGHLESANWTEIGRAGFEAGGATLNISAGGSMTVNGIMASGRNGHNAEINIWDGGLLNITGAYRPQNSLSDINLYGDGILNTWGVDLLNTVAANVTIDIADLAKVVLTQGDLVASLASANDLIAQGVFTGAGVNASVVGSEVWVQIPEPATMSLLGMGALALIRRRRA